MASQNTKLRHRLRFLSQLRSSLPAEAPIRASVCLASTLADQQFRFHRAADRRSMCLRDFSPRPLVPESCREWFRPCQAAQPLSSVPEQEPVWLPRNQMLASGLRAPHLGRSGRVAPQPARRRRPVQRLSPPRRRLFRNPVTRLNTPAQNKKLAAKPKVRATGIRLREFIRADD